MCVLSLEWKEKSVANFFLLPFFSTDDFSLDLQKTPKISKFTEFTVKLQYPSILLNTSS